MSAAWILKAKYIHVRREIDIGDTKEPVAIANISGFLQDEAHRNVAMSVLGKLELSVQSSRELFGKSPDAVCITVDEVDPPLHVDSRRSGISEDLL